jgi:hypothetical protein
VIFDRAKGEDMKGSCYIAQIDTRYGVIGLADTEEGAIHLAAVRAKKFLDNADAYNPMNGEQWTVDSIIEYFSPRVHELKMNSAILEGVEG